MEPLDLAKRGLSTLAFLQAVRNSWSTVTCPPVAMEPMSTPHPQLTCHTPSSRAPEFLAMKVKVEPTSRACNGCYLVLSSQGQTGLEVGEG